MAAVFDTAAMPLPDTDVQYGPPPLMNWVYREQNKRQRVETAHELDGGFQNLQLDDDGGAPAPAPDDDADEEVAGLDEMPDARTETYCYLCEVSSDAKNPDKCRDTMMTFLRTQSRELDPEYLCQCAVVYYNNCVAAEIRKGDPTARPRKFLASTVYEHMTRHMLDPMFTSGRIIQTLRAYDDLYTKTMAKTNTDGTLLPPDHNHAKMHARILKDLSAEMRFLTRNGPV